MSPPDQTASEEQMRETVFGLSPLRLRRENEHLQQKLAETRGLLQQLAETQSKLERENDLLRSPELHEARFLEHDADLAKVVFRGGNRLLGAADGIALASLVPGQVVYLNRDTNVIVRVSQNASFPTGEVGTVERHESDGRLVVSVRGEQLIVRTSGKFIGSVLRAGDGVLVDRDIRMALEPVSRAEEQSWTFQEVPETPPELLGGYDTLRDGVLTQFTLALTQPELAMAYGVSLNPTLMLEGPPGTGKSVLMRVLATMISRITGKVCRVATVNGSELEGIYVGQTQERIKSLFRELREADGPRLLFIEEVEAIARHRGNSVGFHADRFLSTWLAEMQGIRGDAGVAIIATTNRLDLLDKAFADRFAMVKRVDRPRMGAAQEIFGVHLPESFPYREVETQASVTRQRVIDAGVAKLYAPNSENELAVLRFRDGKPRTVTARDLVSGRLIAQCCEAARRRAFQRQAEGGDVGLRESDIEIAVDEKLAPLASVLTVRNVHHYLTDLPTDVDVVSVDIIRRNTNARHYLQLERA